MSSFVDETKDEKNDNEGHGLNGIFLIGTTKTGKSSHVKLLTGENVKIPKHDDTKSCTKVIRQYMVKDNIKNEFELSDENSLFIDTPGLQDSDDLTDDEIFHQIGSSLSKMKIENVKIIWLVLPQEAACQGLQTEATFITKLGQCNENIWKSVIIICKKPNPNDSLKKSIQGPVAAAIRSIQRMNNNNNNNNYDDISEYLVNNACGYQCIEWCLQDSSNERMKRKAAKYAKSAEDAKECQEDFLYSENDIRKLLFNKILKLSFYRVMFYDQKCIQCGINCDPRFPPENLKCHLSMEKVHDQHGEWIHEGYVTDKEIGSRVEWTHGPSGKCPGCVGSIDYLYYKYTSWVSTFTCNCCRSKLMAKEYFYHCKRCCEREHGDGSCVVACRGMFCESCVDDKCNKCHRNKDTSISKGCIPKEEIVYARRYTCCDRDPSSVGCKHHYPCCGQTQPCKKQCVVCKTKWGESPGCVGTQHRFIQ